MIGLYLNQTATWEDFTGHNANGERTFAAGTSIKARWEGGNRLVRNPAGELVTSEARAFTTTVLAPGDRLTYGGKTWDVIAVFEVPGLDGKTVFYEVAM